MANVNIYVEVYCPKCDSENVDIYDYDEMSYYCKCKDCGKQFEDMRD